MFSPWQIEICVITLEPRVECYSNQRAFNAGPPWQILFKPYGEILDIVALSNYYDKGQVPRPIQSSLE